MNAIAQKTAALVAKEEISLFTFPMSDVIIDDKRRAERLKRIITGMKLGNNHKRKVKILFEDIDGLKRVETTIWGTTEKNIILKRGTLIPINRIHEIKFF